MNVEMIREVLGWSTLINYAVLLLWFGMFAGAKGWIKGLHGKWFKLSDEVFDAIHYGSMAVYKLLILVFNLVPWLVMAIII